MSLHDDLLEQARHLATRERKRPKQASLHRAVSATYYGLFHLLIGEASETVAGDTNIVASLNRTLNHGEMQKISKHFVAGKLPKALHAHTAVMVASQELSKLKAVAQAFIDLQQARHEADYNLGMRFTRSDVLRLIDQADKAFADWDVIRKWDFARLYLACFWSWDKWDKDR